METSPTRTFASLSEEEKDLIRKMYTQSADETGPVRAEIQMDLSEKFGVTMRTVRNWARRLSLSKVGPPKQFKILVFDIETAPMKVFTFEKWNTTISDDFIEEDWFMLCWSAKWLFEDKVYNACVTEKEVKRADDSRITKALWRILDEADVVIAHNGRKFDRKKANTRFLKHGLPLPSPYLLIDTLLHARKQFAVTSNRLDYLADFLGVQRKRETPKGLWMACVSGNHRAESLKTMQWYCDGDIITLEEVYLKLRPYIQPHPNIGLHILDEHNDMCPTCGSHDLKEDGEYHTSVNIYQALRCNSCGSLSRKRKTNYKGKVRNGVLSSLPSN